MYSIVYTIQEYDVSVVQMTADITKGKNMHTRCRPPYAIVHINIHTHTHTHLYICIYINIYIGVCECVGACLLRCMYIVILKPL